MSLYEALKASKTQQFPDYWTLLWGRKLSASMIKTITGTLPLTFTSKGGNAVDWTISGNNNIGANKFEFADDTKVDGDTTFVADGESGTITATGLPDMGTTYILVSSVNTFPAGDYVFTGDTDAGTTTHYMYVRKYGDNTTIANDYGEDRQNFTLTEATRLTIFCRLTSTNPETIHIFKPMICKQGETPSTFEPYQIGVGERTKNVLDVSPFNDVDINNIIMTLNDDATISVYTTDTPPAQAQGLCNFMVDKTGNYLFSGVPEDAPNSALNCYIWDRDISGRAKSWDKVTDMDSCSRSNQSVEVYLEQGVRYQLRVRVQTSYGKHEEPVTVSPMIRLDGTTDSFIPYGYQVPITVSQDGQTDKHYDIFIGGSHLTEGETVSKTSTGIDIELFEGENTVSTTLTNKPEMTIKYK